MATTEVRQEVLTTDETSTNIDDMHAPVRRRVAPLAPDDRRAALIEATIPLLIEHGTAISTRQIAQAAGVAEGTIFRVFPDKASLIMAAVRHGIDPGAGVKAISEIPAEWDLRTRLTKVADGMLTGMAKVGRLHMIARECVMNEGPTSDFGGELRANHARVQAALTALIEPDADRLRVAPAMAAQLLLMHLVSMSGAVFGEVRAIAPDEVVSLLLDGLLAPTHDD
jgi:AcrR family transcriptional regulator